MVVIKNVAEISVVLKLRIIFKVLLIIVIVRWDFLITSSSKRVIINMFPPDPVSRTWLLTQKSILESSFLLGSDSLSSAAKRCSCVPRCFSCASARTQRWLTGIPNAFNPGTAWGLERKCCSWPEVEGLNVTSHMTAALMWVGCSCWWNHILASNCSKYLSYVHFRSLQLGRIQGGFHKNLESYELYCSFPTKRQVCAPDSRIIRASHGNAQRFFIWRNLVLSDGD